MQKQIIVSFNLMFQNVRNQAISQSKRMIVFFSSFKNICDAVLNDEQIKCIPGQDMNHHCKKLQETLTNHVPDFETLLPLRQWANEIASSCVEVAFSPV